MNKEIGRSKDWAMESFKKSGDRRREYLANVPAADLGRAAGLSIEGSVPEQGGGRVKYDANATSERERDLSHREKAEAMVEARHSLEMQTAQQMLEEGELTQQEYDILLADAPRRLAREKQRQAAMSAQREVAEGKIQADRSQRSSTIENAMKLSAKKAAVAEFYKQAAADAEGFDEDEKGSNEGSYKKDKAEVA